MAILNSFEELIELLFFRYPQLEQVLFGKKKTI